MINEKDLIKIRDEQKHLAEKVIIEDLPNFVSGPVTGVDVAYGVDYAIGCAVTIDTETKKVLETKTIRYEKPIQYYPGLFQIREGPILLSLLSQMTDHGPVLIDGHGVLHPRKFGLASFVGVNLDIQTIGVAKSLLVGKLGERKKNRAPVFCGGELLGVALWLHKQAKPIYISVGHKVTLETAVEIVQASCVKGKSFPLYLAHKTAKALLNKETS